MGLDIDELREEVAIDCVISPMLHAMSDADLDVMLGS
jgi:hypothetical protein